MRILCRICCVIAVLMLACVALSAGDIAQTISPSDLITVERLNSEMPAVNSGKIVLIHVGFHTMYGLGHIPGSKYEGAASTLEGLAKLQQAVAKLPRNQQIVIYCGCCPWDHCPNIRPAFHALKAMGFTNLKALDIPQRFGDDWTAKGFPVAKGE
jgi:thiosulfate/3-mercaptopyruvate sulfurtransferase